MYICYFVQTEMSFTVGAYLVIFYTVLLHFNLTAAGNTALEFHLLKTGANIGIALVQGFVTISYPLIGLLADTKSTRYGMICLSCWVLLVSHLLLSIESIIQIVTISTVTTVADIIYFVVAALLFVLAIVGKGMFGSTAIQFGTDQMIEASSNELSAFIHWYYWSAYIGKFCVTITGVGIAQYFSHCVLHVNNFHYHDTTMVIYTLIPLCILQSILCCITLLLLYLKKFKNYLNIEPVGINPAKQIIDVLKYAYHHKYPVRRSAFSYYQNTYPSRINFGKVQYGGPFTNEEVEDVKTVLRLVVLLLSLFGFHLSSDGAFVYNRILHKVCPSSLILLYFIGNPSIITNIVTLLGIPIFHALSKTSLQKYIPNMTKRMWIGLMLMCLQELVSLIVTNQVRSSERCSVYEHSESSTKMCYLSIIQYVNNTEWNTTDCVSVCPSSLYTMDSTLMWLLVSQILHGFGYMLTCLSVLEFICAQAPFRLKGFMIGVWYATFSIKYLFSDIIDEAVAFYYKEEKAWIIYESIKTGIIGLNLIIFGITCRWYKYRERDEVVNVQGMIEDIFERELLQQQNEESSDSEDITLILPQNINYNTFD